MAPRAPFKPFQPLDELEAPVASWSDAEEVVTRSLSSAPHVAIVSGPVGAGKSSFLRARATPLAQSAGWKVVQLPGTALADVDHALAVVASALGLTLRADDVVAGGRGQATQSTGAVVESEGVRVTQVFTEAGRPGSRPETVAARLAAVVAAAGVKTCFVIDQVEVIWLDERATARDVLGAVIDLAAVPEFGAACVVGIREKFVGDLLLALRRLPAVGRNIAMLNGITAEEALSYARAALARAEIEIGSRALSRVVRNAKDASGLVWPVALQAGLDEMVRSRSSARRARGRQPRDPLVAALESRLANLDRHVAEDALYVLHEVARISSIAGPQELGALQQELALPEYDLRIALASLVALGFLQEVRPTVYALAHDSLLGAVLRLRAGSAADEPLRRNDAAVAGWHLSGRPIDSRILGALIDAAGSDALPTSHLVALAGSMFDAWMLGQSEIETIRPRLASLDGDQIERMLRARARRLGRPETLEPSELFVALLPGTAKGAELALEALVAATRVGSEWAEPEIARAVVAADNANLLAKLADAGIATLPAAVARVVLTAQLHAQAEIRKADLRRIWNDAPEALSLDVLLVLERHRPQWLGRTALELTDHPQAALAGVALRIVAETRPRGWRDAFLAALDSPEVERRRRAVFCLPSAGDEMVRFDLPARFRSEASALVREAFLEVTPDLTAAVQRQLVELGLADESAIVRESAVYAARTALDPEEALEVARIVHGDASPLVREAVLHLYAGFNRLPPSDLVLRDVRMGAIPLRGAAARLIDALDRGEAWVALAEVIVDGDTPREVRAAALKAAERIAAPDLVPSIASVLASTSDLSEAAKAIDVLEAIGDEASQSLLATATHHPSPDLRERAVYALARVGGPEAEATLEASILDAEPAVQARAIYGLGRLGHRRAAPLIRDLPRRTTELDRAIQWYLATLEVEPG